MEKSAKRMKSTRNAANGVLIFFLCTEETLRRPAGGRLARRSTEFQDLVKVRTGHARAVYNPDPNLSHNPNLNLDPSPISLVGASP